MRRQDEMKGLMAILLMIVLLWVGLSAFGGAIQNVDSGVADSLILPVPYKVEGSQRGETAKIVAYAEFAAIFITMKKIEANQLALLVIRDNAYPMANVSTAITGKNSEVITYLKFPPVIQLR
jgi:hypothetical protein